MNSMALRILAQAHKAVSLSHNLDPSGCFKVLELEVFRLHKWSIPASLKRPKLALSGRQGQGQDTRQTGLLGFEHYPP